VTKSSGYTVAFAVALPIAPENAWTRGGSVLVIAGVKDNPDSGDVTVMVQTRDCARHLKKLFFFN
jgi:hypothetical protein